MTLLKFHSLIKMGERDAQLQRVNPFPQPEITGAQMSDEHLSFYAFQLGVGAYHISNLTHQLIAMMQAEEKRQAERN